MFPGKNLWYSHPQISAVETLLLFLWLGLAVFSIAAVVPSECSFLERIALSCLFLVRVEIVAVAAVVAAADTEVDIVFVSEWGWDWNHLRSC